jgi:hypothetical protein
MTDKNLLILACHTNSILKKNSLLHNIRYFYELCNNIVIINSLECKDIELEDKLNVELKLIDNSSKLIFEYIPNDKYLCQGKWMYYLNKIHYTVYDNIILTNDSFLITRSLNDYKALIKPSVELVALLDSYQMDYHHPDFLRTYNLSGIRKLLNYFEQNKSNITNTLTIIRYYEVKSSRLFDNIEILYKNETKEDYNIHFDNFQLERYLYELNYPIIKLKKITSHFYNDKNMPSDFDPVEYRSLHPDLLEFDDNFLINHFSNAGIYEGRLYKKNQKNELPLFFQNYLQKINFLIKN